MWIAAAIFHSRRVGKDRDLLSALFFFSRNLGVQF
jgi:hypothetical protein